jgi:hypothetical protein
MDCIEHGLTELRITIAVIGKRSDRYKISAMPSSALHQIATS